MRTDNEIKNYWNTQLKKKLLRMGLDPATHKPKTTTFATSLLDAKASGNSTADLSHMSQWESARLEAEARLVKESQMRAKTPWPSSIKLNITSSRRTWDSLVSNLLSDNDTAELLGNSASCEAISTSKLINDFQNWEKCLQGQTGLGISEDNMPSLPLQTSSSEFDVGTPASSMNTSYPPVDVVQSTITGSIPAIVDGESIVDPSFDPFQDLVFEHTTVLQSSCHGASPDPSAPATSEDPLNMDVCERYLVSIPPLVSSTATSSSLLEELDLVSEDSSSSSSLIYGGIPPNPSYIFPSCLIRSNLPDDHNVKVQNSQSTRVTW